MRRTALVGMALLLVSCGSGDKRAATKDTSDKETSAPAAAKTPSKHTREAGVLDLDESQQQRVHIVVEAVRTKTVSDRVSAQGQLALNEDRIWHVGAVAGGRVASLPVRLGDSVRRGQIIGRIHSHDEHEARAAFQQCGFEADEGHGRPGDVQVRAPDEGHAHVRRRVGHGVGVVTVLQISFAHSFPPYFAPDLGNREMATHNQ